MPPAEVGTTRIQLCGRLKADVEGRHVTPQLRGRQGRVLLAYLVMNRGRPVSRSELIAAIWPETPPADPAAALRTQLSRLRSAMGSEALAGRDAVELRLPANTWIDVEASERSILAADSALKSADWKDAWAHAHIALNISGRPFLAGFDAPWVEDVRRELEELHLRSREVIARAGIGLGGSELAGAERAARALIRLAPFRESGYLLLMRALVASGNTAEALRTYDELRNLLAEELGSAPGAEVQALHRRLLGGEDLPGDEVELAPPGTTPAAVQADPEPATDMPLPTWLLPRRRSPFIGRKSELGHLDELWRDARSGGRRIVFVGGDPGVGKTRLATEFAGRVHASGGGVLYGRAAEEASQSYQPFVEALRHWAINAGADEIEVGLGPNAGVLATLVPEIMIRLEKPPTVADGEIARDMLFDAVIGTLAAISRDRPTLLVIDDLHWADAGSLLMLRQLARSPHRSSLMVLATYRETQPSEALSATLADLGRERLFGRLHLEGLSREEVAELVASIRGNGPDSGLADTIYEETGGNPFLVEALVDHVIAAPEGEPVFAPGSRAAIYSGGVPALVREAVGHRVTELGTSGVAVLEVASVIGREFESELLIEVSDLPGEDVIGALEVAVAAGLLTDVPGTLDRYAFSHSLFRQTVYEGIPKTRRTALHRRLAEVLEARHGADPRHVSELARHFAGAGPATAAKALEYGVRAGAGALGALAFEESVEHYRSALFALESSDSQDEALRCELLIALGDVEWRAGDSAASRETFARAARIARGSGDGEALARAALGFCGHAWAHVGSGDAEAVELLEAALAANPDPGPMRTRTLARLAEALHGSGNAVRADQISREALEEARASSDDEALAAAVIGRWYARCGPEGLEERASLTRELLAIAARLRDRDVEIHARQLQVIVCLELGDFGELDVAISSHAVLADQMKQPAGQLRNRTFVAMRALMEGRFGETERLAAEVLDQGAVSQTPSAVHYSALALYLLRWEQGRLGEMEAPIRDLAERFRSMGIWRAMLAFMLADSGAAEAARAEIDRVGLNQLSERAHDDTWLAEVAFVSMAVVALGDANRAAALHAMLEAHAGRAVVVGGSGAYLSSTSHHLGLLALLLDRREEAIAHLEEAVNLNQRAGALPWLARARFHLAENLAERGLAGEPERAGRLLAEAGRTAEQLRMAAFLERIEESRAREALRSPPPSPAG
jgi:predicted ATPase/DNA-binding SARP family transcriptional activator